MSDHSIKQLRYLIYTWMVLLYYGRLKSQYFNKTNRKSEIILGFYKDFLYDYPLINCLLPAKADMAMKIPYIAVW